MTRHRDRHGHGGGFKIRDDTVAAAARPPGRRGPGVTTRVLLAFRLSPHAGGHAGGYRLKLPRRIIVPRLSEEHCSRLPVTRPGVTMIISRRGQIGPAELSGQ